MEPLEKNCFAPHLSFSLFHRLKLLGHHSILPREHYRQVQGVAAPSVVYLLYTTLAKSNQRRRRYRRYPATGAGVRRLFDVQGMGTDFECNHSETSRYNTADKRAKASAISWPAYQSYRSTNNKPTREGEGYRGLRVTTVPERHLQTPLRPMHARYDPDGRRIRYYVSPYNLAGQAVQDLDRFNN